MKKRLPLNPKTELFRWGPSPLRYFYQHDFNLMMVERFPAVFPRYRWPVSLALYYHHRVLWVNEFPALRRAGQRVFIGLIMNRQRRAGVRQGWRRERRRLMRLERWIDAHPVRQLTDATLLETWMGLHRRIQAMFVFGLVPELANYGNAELLRNQLRRYVPARSLDEVLGSLIAPTGMSFYQREELALARATSLTRHQRRYSWIENSYSRVRRVSLRRFAARRRRLDPHLERRIRRRLASVRRAKLRLAHDYRLPRRIMEVAAGVSECMLWQDERKATILRHLAYKDALLAEMGHRRSWRKDDMLNLSYREIADAFGGRDVTSIIAQRRRGFGEIVGKRLERLDRATTASYWAVYTHARAPQRRRYLQGIVASRGRGSVRGRVRIVLDPHRAAGFRSGEILLAPYTSPEYVFLMKRASAIVTDAGGLTSHAAITSRELGKLCIVGTEVATHVLKDGDLVEVLANHGTIRILRRAKH